MQTQNTEIVKESSNNLRITREFKAPVKEVWKAWTESALLDQWWAPKPWKAVTESMDFKEGGVWRYYMQGPDGTKSWCRVDYETIVPFEKFSGYDAFCDESGKITNELPRMFWNCEFVKSDGGTRVNILITFDSEEDRNKIIEMGFEQGFTAAHGNLDALLAGSS